MDLFTAMEKRHSVRSYSLTPINKETVGLLQDKIDECNRESGLHMQLVLNEPKAFSCRIAKYGHFQDVKNYIVLAGPKGMDNLEEKCGYYGEKIVLFAQQLGLDTCWVGLTYKKIENTFHLEEDDKVVIVISIGYGKEMGKKHRSKAKEAVSNIEEDNPIWFKKGLKYALLAPTAMNQQKFKILLFGNKVEAIAGIGPFSKVDLGIVKYHFEIGAGKENFEWL